MVLRKMESGKIQDSTIPKQHPNLGTSILRKGPSQDFHQYRLSRKLLKKDPGKSMSKIAPFLKPPKIDEKNNIPILEHSFFKKVHRKIFINIVFPENS